MEEPPVRSTERLAGLRDLIPVAAVVLIGAFVIVSRAQNGPRSTHMVWLSAVLVENTLALLLRRRHPIGAFVGVLAAYVVVDYQGTTLLPLLLALLAAAAGATVRGRFVLLLATAAAIVATPAVHRDSLNVGHQFLIPIVGLALAVAAVRYQRQRFDADARGRLAP